jgi:hypothetical protein
MAAPFRERDIDRPDFATGSYLSRVLDTLQRLERRIEDLHVDMEELRRELRMRTGGTTEPHRGMAVDADDVIDDVLGVQRGIQGERPPVDPHDIDFNGPNMDRLRNFIMEEARRYIDDPDEVPDRPEQEPELPDDTPHVVGSI